MVVVGIPSLRTFNPIVTGRSVFYDQKLDVIYTFSPACLLYLTGFPENQAEKRVSLCLLFQTCKASNSISILICISLINALETVTLATNNRVVRISLCTPRH